MSIGGYRWGRPNAWNTPQPSVNPASRYIQQGIDRYGPGSSYNTNAWIQAAVSPYITAGISRYGPGSDFYNNAWGAQTTGPARVPAGQGLSPSSNYSIPSRPQNTNPRAAANVIADAVNRHRGQPTPQPTGNSGQTQVRYPNGSVTTYNPPSGGSSGGGSSGGGTPQTINRTWGSHAGPGVTNAGNILNAPLELGLGPFAQYLQNTATAAAHESNLNQYQGSAPPPPSTGGGGGSGGGSTPPRTSNPPQTQNPAPAPAPAPAPTPSSQRQGVNMQPYYDQIRAMMAQNPTWYQPRTTDNPLYAANAIASRIGRR